MNVSLPSFEEQKKEIELSLARTIVTNLELQKISFEEAQPIAQFILEGMKNAATPKDLLVFLQSLAQQWIIFESVYGLYRLKIKDELETQDDLQEAKDALKSLGGNV